MEQRKEENDNKFYAANCQDKELKKEQQMPPRKPKKSTFIVDKLKGKTSRKKERKNEAKKIPGREISSPLPTRPKAGKRGERACP